MSSSPSRPRRALFGVAREDWERLEAELEAQRAAAERAEAARAQLQARDEARTARLDAVLADAATIVGELQAATEAIARFAAADEPDEEALADAMQGLLGRRAARVEVLRAAELPNELARAVGERQAGVVTLARTSADAAAESLLDVTAARAGEVAIVVRWAEEVYDDGSLRAIAEALSRAAAASLAGRAFARDGGRRQPVTLLGDGADADRFTALREAQGQPLEWVRVQVAPDAPETYSGIFGEPAWDGERFHLALELDRSARELGGEAFELPAAFASLVPRAAAEKMRIRARAILASSSVEADVLEP